MAMLRSAASDLRRPGVAAIKLSLVQDRGDSQLVAPGPKSCQVALAAADAPSPPLRDALTRSMWAAAVEIGAGIAASVGRAQRCQSLFRGVGAAAPVGKNDPGRRHQAIVV